MWEGSQKRKTHFVLGFDGTPFRYRIQTFKRAVGYSAISDPAATWFYKGYLLHLITDANWMKRCIFPAGLRYLFSRNRASDLRELYYQEMIETDAYFRCRFQHHESEVRSLRLLADTRQPSFFPGNLNYRAVDDIVRVLSETRTRFSDKLPSKFLRETDVDRFIEKSCNAQL